MKPKILITGPPRCGKSTLISMLIEYFKKKSYKIEGFLTPEIRKKGKRIGFDIKNLNTGEQVPLARIGTHDLQFKLGRYSIFLENLEKTLDKLKFDDIKKADFLIIDEIGKMELFSKKFQELLKKLFKSDISILATIGQKLKHPIKDHILKIPNIVLLNLTKQNQQEIFKKIISMV